EGGTPLPELVDAEGRLSWEAARELLRQLADELAASCADGTLPPSLSTGQVWVRADGRALLLDMRPPDAEAEVAADDERRARALLRRVAVLALEGRKRPAGEPLTPVRAPLPPHASRLLAGPYECVEEFRRALADSEDWPARVGRSRRTIHL